MPAQRYLVGRLQNGLGNRQQQVAAPLLPVAERVGTQAASYLLLAMRTDRALLLDHLDHHITRTPWRGDTFEDAFNLSRHDQAHPPPALHAQHCGCRSGGGLKQP